MVDHDKCAAFDRRITKLENALKEIISINDEAIVFNAEIEAIAADALIYETG